MRLVLLICSVKVPLLWRGGRGGFFYKSQGRVAHAHVISDCDKFSGVCNTPLQDHPAPSGHPSTGGELLSVQIYNYNF